MRAATLSGVETEATGGDGVSQEVGSGGADFGLGRGKFKTVFACSYECKKHVVSVFFA